MPKPLKEAGGAPSMTDVFAGFVVRDLELEVSNTDKSLADCERRFKVAEEKLAAELARQQGLLERRKEIREGENFGAEFDALLRNKKITAINVMSNPDKIVVVTSELCVPFDGKKYFIDPLRVEVSFDKVSRPASGFGHAGDFAPISVFPSHSKQKVSPDGYPGEGPNWPAPHVRGDGSICLGTISEIVMNAWNQQEWTVVVELMIEFLEACNPERRDAYFKVLNNVAIRVE